MRDWKQRIVDLVLIQQDIRGADSAHIWSYHLPEAAATEGALVEVEAVLGCTLPQEYREFLAHADGWSGMFHDVRLLSIPELKTARRSGKAADLVGSLRDSGELGRQDFALEALLPIGVSKNDIDIFALVLNGEQRGMVAWFAGAEIQRFAGFVDFFEAMIEYNRAEAAALRAGNGPSA